LLRCTQSTQVIGTERNVAPQQGNTIVIAAQGSATLHRLLGFAAQDRTVSIVHSLPGVSAPDG
jgi:hypothetical protein